MQLENPYASPSSDTTQDPAVRPGIVEVRWARPRVATFAQFSMHWSFATGIIVGILASVAALFDDQGQFHIGVWRLEGILAALAAFLLVPLLFLMLGVLVAIWSPVFRVLAILTGGPRLRFRAHDTRRLEFSALCLRSFILMASVCGLFYGLFVLLIATLISGGKLGEVSISGVPEVLNQVPGVAWRAFLLPTMFAVYAGLAAVPAFLPFRYLARRSRVAFFHYSEITPGL